VSQYQKGKTNLDFTEARDSEWQWHQPGRIYVSMFFNRNCFSKMKDFSRLGALQESRTP